MQQRGAGSPDPGRGGAQRRAPVQRPAVQASVSKAGNRAPSGATESRDARLPVEGADVALDPLRLWQRLCAASAGAPCLRPTNGVEVWRRAEMTCGAGWVTILGFEVNRVWCSTRRVGRGRPPGRPARPGAWRGRPRRRAVRRRPRPARSGPEARATMDARGKQGDQRSGWAARGRAADKMVVGTGKHAHRGRAAQ